MDLLSVPSLDGFADRFYRHCWDIIDQNIILVVQEFFSISRDFFRAKFQLQSSCPKDADCAQGGSVSTDYSR